MAILRYTIEASVIIIGILFSFYIEEIRSQNKNIEIKNELLSDLNIAINNDLSQIQEVQPDVKFQHYAGCESGLDHGAPFVLAHLYQ